MEFLPDASKYGFVQDPSKLDSSGENEQVTWFLDSVIIDNFAFPKYIPEPQFLNESDIVFKR